MTGHAPAGRLLVFDLDGTLIDSAADLAASGNDLLESFGAAPLAPADVLAMVGDGARVLVGRLLASRGVTASTDEALARFLDIYHRRALDTTRPYPGTLDTLEALRPRARMAVLTNKPEAHTHLLLDALALAPFFEDVIGGDGPYPKKPDPTALLALAERAGVEPARALMIGDSLADLEAAGRAGVPAVVARYGFGFAQIPPERASAARWQIERISELTEVVERI